MQELTDCNKRPNLRIMGIEEGEEVQAKGMCNIFNKIITKFPKSREIYSHTDARGLQNTKQTRQNRSTPQHIIIKTTNTEARERILKAVREKKQITYKGKPIKITADFSTETLKSRRA
jgi:ribosomal protein L39E